MAVQLRYPLDRIDKDTDHMSITVLKYEAPGLPNNQSGRFQFPRGSDVNIANFAVAPGQISNIRGNIKLPMPDNLSDTNQVGWTESELDARDAFILGTGKSVLDATQLAGGKFSFGDAFDAIKGAFGDGLEAAQNQQVRDAIENYLLGQAANVFTGNVDGAKLVSRATGLALNPNLELLFKGPKLRKFTFPFTFAPRNREEGLQVKGIINTFKKRMAANDSVSEGTAASGIFIAAPDVFEIKFLQGNKPHPFLFKLKTCALTDMVTNYADGTPYVTYYDGTPVKINMTLTFTELNPIYSSDYRDVDPTQADGVGF